MCNFLRACLWWDVECSDFQEKCLTNLNTKKSLEPRRSTSSAVLNWTAVPFLISRKHPTPRFSFFIFFIDDFWLEDLEIDTWQPMHDQPLLSPLLMTAYCFVNVMAVSLSTYSLFTILKVRSCSKRGPLTMDHFTLESRALLITEPSPVDLRLTLWILDRVACVGFSYFNEQMSFQALNRPSAPYSFGLRGESTPCLSHCNVEMPRFRSILGCPHSPLLRISEFLEVS